MDLNLQIKPRTQDALLASYSCPCGCNPRVTYRRDSDHIVDGCCCGNTFVVGEHAAAHLQAAEGFRLHSQPFAAPWGEELEAAWAIGPSVDPGASEDEAGHGHDHAHGNGHEHHHGDDHEQPAAAAPATSAIDPVCGMTVVVATATERGLHFEYKGTAYYFCGKGCRLEFGDDPEKYLDPSYVPSM